MELTFGEFLILIRDRIGNYCTDAYWKWKYNDLENHQLDFILSELSYLAVMAVATDYGSKHG